MADDMNLEAEIDTALAGGSPEAVVEAGPAAVAPLAARLAAAKTTDEKSTLVDLLSAVGGADALAPVLPYISDADPDLRARASAAALKVVLANGPPSGPVAEQLQTEVTAALEAPDAEGGVLLLGALAPGAEDALETHLSGTRLVKAQPQEPTAPAALAARLALSALGDDEARTSLLRQIPEAEPDSLVFMLKALPLIDAPEVLHALAATTLSSDAPVADGLPSGVEPAREVADIAVEAFVARLSLTPGFKVTPGSIYTADQRAEVERLITGSIPN
ncbi:hypothetical protein [Roseibium aggregatum]|uniref:hypothetical protein n=1 Tax=Roseibium aggregatum TaxID=187304 RepID=UPI0011150740|nr:hypothetical protein [Roseibium aggregatum]UFI04137.1 hypothetical protein ST40_003095 [Roseibium aggregatum]